MLLLPGGQATVHFDTSAAGIDTPADAIDATVYRNDVATSIVPTVVLEGTSHYVVTFAVPINWVALDTAYVQLTTDYLSADLSCTKYAGQIDPNILVRQLAQAEQTKTDNGDGTTTIRYWLAGSNRTVLLRTELFTGDPCEGDMTVDVI